jgi:hypothetical protein
MYVGLRDWMKLYVVVEDSGNNWEDTDKEEIQAYIGILIYMGLVDLPWIEDYFQGDFCVCPIVRQAVTHTIQKTGTIFTSDG